MTFPTPNHPFHTKKRSEWLGFSIKNSNFAAGLLKHETIIWRRISNNANGKKPLVR